MRFFGLNFHHLWRVRLSRCFVAEGANSWNSQICSIRRSETVQFPAFFPSRPIGGWNPIVVRLLLYELINCLPLAITVIDRFLGLVKIISLSEISGSSFAPSIPTVHSPSEGLALPWFSRSE